MAAKQNFNIEKGATFRRVLNYKGKNKRPVNLTGFTAKLQIRSSVTDPSVLVELSTDNSGIAISGSAGKLTVVMGAAATSAITFATGVYDLFLYGPGEPSSREVIKLLEGKITVSERVTRE